MLLPSVAFGNSHSRAIPAAQTAPKLFYPIWGNNEIADCTFAAAADWELAALGHSANEAQIRREYVEAGGETQGGIPESKFIHWWAHHGIGNIRVQLHEVLGENNLFVNSELLPINSIIHIKRLLSRAHYLLADMNWGNHEILLTGYNTNGLTYVTYGEEQLMSWHEWREDSWGLFTLAIIN
jgi:hypothetical protein